MIIHLAYLIYKKQQHIHMNTIQQNNPIKYYLPVSALTPHQKNCEKTLKTSRPSKSIS